MPFQVTKTTVKPSIAHFFNDVKSHTLKSYRDWVLSQPGVLSFEGKQGPDENTWISTIVFNNEESFQTFRTTVSSHTTHVARQVYNNANGITVTVTTKEI